MFWCEHILGDSAGGDIHVLIIAPSFAKLLVIYDNLLKP
jgi:hypothetical protein